MASRSACLLIGVLLALAGCSGKKRRFAETSPLLPAAGAGADAATVGGGDGDNGATCEGADCECGPDGCVLALGASCATPAECTSGACEVNVAGASICCAQACAAQGQACTADGAGCTSCRQREPV